MWSGIVTGADADAIRREIRDGTPNTPQRIATIKRAMTMAERMDLYILGKEPSGSSSLPPEGP